MRIFVAEKRKYPIFQLANNGRAASTEAAACQGRATRLANERSATGTEGAHDV